MAPLQKLASSLLWLAAISSAQLITVTRTTDGPLPTTIRQPAPNNINIPEAEKLARPRPNPTTNTGDGGGGPQTTFIVGENGVLNQRSEVQPLTSMVPVSTPTGTVSSSEVLPTPTMWNLDSAEPDCGEAAVGYLQVDLQGAVSKEQAAVFRGIPAEAKRCSLGWKQADKGERNFQVGEQGMTKVRQLSGFPAEGEPVTFNSLREFEPANATVWSPDFSFWPDYDQWDHPSGQIQCSEDIYLRIVINKEGGDGFVHLDQDEKNGFYIAYTL